MLDSNHFLKDYDDIPYNFMQPSGINNHSCGQTPFGQTGWSQIMSKYVSEGGCFIIRKTKMCLLPLAANEDWNPLDTSCLRPEHTLAERTCGSLWQTGQ